jgi:membrane-bound serine protease (ClpP class)
MRSWVVEQNRETSIPRRTLVAAFLALCTLVGVLAGARPAAARSAAGPVKVDVVEVSGLLDPIQVDFMARAVREASSGGAAALVIRLDSPGSVAPAADLRKLEQAFRTSGVPVAVWIGPGRQARADHEANGLFRAAGIRGMAPGSHAGALPAAAAFRSGAATVQAATLGDFIVGLDGQTDASTGRTVSIPTKTVTRPGRPPQRAPEAQVRFSEPSLVAQLLHAVATPSAAYLLLVVGLLLIVFEFFTAGVGVAGGVGVACVALAGYGLGVLPTRPGSLALVAAGVLGMSIDVQAGAPRAWTVIGTLLFVTGSFFLFTGISVPLLVLALVVAGVALFMVAGMPAMVRTRFSTPTIGRESMLGEQGTALSDVDPDGVVTVRDAPWRARTNRATPIRAGEPVRVAAIDGLLLEVEPLEGAAKDAGH